MPLTGLCPFPQTIVLAPLNHYPDYDKYLPSYIHQKRPRQLGLGIGSGVPLLMPRLCGVWKLNPPLNLLTRLAAESLQASASEVGDY